MKIYNINELLDKKKEIQEQLIVLSREITTDSLTYKKDTYIDLTSKIEKEFEERKMISFNDYTMKFNSLSKELSKIKTIISKFNADNISELLYSRDNVRNTIMYLNAIKVRLPKNNNIGRKTNRTDSNDIAVEVIDFEIRPMFKLEDLDKSLNELSAEERKLNTSIQKINLNAELEL